MKRIALLLIGSLLACAGCSGDSDTPVVNFSELDGKSENQEKENGRSKKSVDKKSKDKKGKKKLETATFGAGCFWCVEAVFESLKGVESVESGYCNGEVPNPTYRQVCTGLTGHAEVCRVKFDPEVISFEELLEVFWNTHDPTTLNRQGADVGSQYRSGVYYHSEEQKELAEKWKKKINDAKIWPKPIVTEITKAEKFYKAEDYHQQYYELNGDQPYCRAVINPKMDKLKKLFKDKLKD